MFKRVILCCAGLACLSSYADTYKRGTFTCNSFSKAEQRYREDPADMFKELAYGQCLITVNRDAEGLTHVKSASKQGDIHAAYFLAQYYHTGGTLQALNTQNIQLAISAYLTTSSMIREHGIYPFGGYTPVEEKLRFKTSLGVIYATCQVSFYRYFFVYG